MQFFNEPKLKRIAKHLQSLLQSTHQDKRSSLLFLKSKEDNTNSLYFKKEDFSGQFDLDFLCGVDSNPQLKMANANKQEAHYHSLLFNAGQIVEELDNYSPDYARIAELAREIKNKSTLVPSIISSHSMIELKMTYFSGGNLFTDFCSGLIGLIHAPIIALIGLFFIPAFVNGESKYCGGSEFFLDTAKYFCDSLLKVICSLVFPLAMLRSKYETDSFNVVKGELMRSIESIIVLAEKEGEKSIALTIL